MQTALRLTTTVLSGNRIEVIAPELSEGSRVDLIVTDSTVELFRRYPSALEAEYDALVDKELHGTLTNAETLRLQDICRVIAEIDRLTLSDDIRNRGLDQVEADLARLRTEIEALPDV